MTTAACTNYQGLYVQRFFLGALESGVSPGWMLVVGGNAYFCYEDPSYMMCPLTCLHRMVQKTGTSISNGCMVLYDRLRVYRLSVDQLRTRYAPAQHDV